jgi:mitogen-activated protein kinase 1/3
MYPRSHTTVNGTDFHVASRYRVIKPIGSGAYGIVVSAEDTVTGRRVAIKKVGNAYQ